MKRPAAYLRLVLTLPLLAGGCGGTRSYENKVHPERSLASDREECSRQAQSRALEVPYNDPEVYSKRAMIGENEFTLCMRSRGWTEARRST
jgi:hypothetical protein